MASGGRSLLEVGGAIPMDPWNLTWRPHAPPCSPHQPVGRGSLQHLFVELEVSGLAVILALLFLAQVCVWGVEASV